MKIVVARIKRFVSRVEGATEADGYDDPPALHYPDDGIPQHRPSRKRGVTCDENSAAPFPIPHTTCRYGVSYPPLAYLLIGAAALQCAKGIIKSAQELT